MEVPESSASIDSSGNTFNPSHSSLTEIRVEKITHTWTVENFSHCYQEYLENFVNDDPLTWSIKIYPKGNGENNKDFVFLCLNKVVAPNASKSAKIGFKSRFILRSVEDRDIEMRIHPNPSHSDYVSYIKRDVLFPQILPQDLIVVLVEIEAAVETITTTSEPPMLQPIFSRKQLMDDYYKLFRDGILTDFTIKIGSNIVHTHRAILAARSPVFAAMFTHDNTSEGELEIKDLTHEVVVEMLNYIYSGRCNKNISHIARDLLIAADKYCLEELKSHCEQTIVDDLNVENACDSLILADAYMAPFLKKQAVQYIIQRPVQVTNTAGWDFMLKENPALITDIVNQFGKGCVTTSSAEMPSSAGMSSSPEMPSPANEGE